MDKNAVGKKVTDFVLWSFDFLALIFGTFFLTVSLFKCAENNYDWNTKMLIPYWGQYSDTFSIVSAVIFFFVAFAFTKKYAILWLMFYDSTFELMSVPFAYTNWNSLFMFGLTIALMLLLRIKIQNHWKLFSCWLLLVILAASQKNWSEFMTQGSWLFIIAVTQFLKVKENENNL